MKHASFKLFHVLVTSVTVGVLLGFVLLFSVGARTSIPGSSFTRPRFEAQHALVRQLLLHEHHFIPASDSSLKYCGRWTVLGNCTARESNFPGSYIEVIVTNTSALYLDLSQPACYSDASQSRRRHGDGAMDVLSSSSLVVELADRSPLHFQHTGDALLTVATGLDSSKEHSMRLTLLGTDETQYRGLFGFDGLWLSKGGTLSIPRQGQNLLSQRPHIEFLSGTTIVQPTDATYTYSTLVGSSLELPIVNIPVPASCLTEYCAEGQPSVQDVFFNVDGELEAQFWTYKKVATSARGALVLSLGLRDFQHFLGLGKSNQEVDRFVQNFVQTYAEFVSTIRRVGYRPAGPGREPVLDRQASYKYNSAPSTLPIFVVTPFTSSRSLRLLLGHAASAVVQEIRANGDLSTIWLDTQGWLSQEDFVPRLNGSSAHATDRLTHAGHARVAAHLSTQLCPYFRQDCPYSKHTVFDGHLYVPAEAGTGKLLEDRKVALVKEFLKLS